MKKRILYCLSSLNRGGMEMVVLNYLNHMNLDLFQIDFLIFYGKEGCWDSYLREKGCNVTYFSSEARSFFARNSEAKDFFRNNKYDIVHIHAMTSLKYRYAKMAKKAGVKSVIYHSHNSSNETHLFLHKLFRSRLNQWCDFRFACSQEAGKFMYTKKFHCIRNAIDLEKFRFSFDKRERLRKQYLCSDSIVIGNIARFTKIKNQQFLLKLAQRMAFDFKMILIGDGDEKKNIEIEAESLGLKEKISFIGNIEDPSEFYSMFDVIAFPSKFEGLSVVMVEAQANGCRIVGSDQMTKETALSPDVTFLPIDETAENYEKWVDCIHNCGNYERKDNKILMQSRGYDIKIEAKKLEKFYLGI